MTKWVESIRFRDLFDAFDEGKPFTETRDAIVARLRSSAWVQQSNKARDQVDVLELQDDLEGFNYEWDGLYTLADWDRVWLDVMTAPENRPS